MLFHSCPCLGKVIFLLCGICPLLGKMVISARRYLPNVLQVGLFCSEVLAHAWATTAYLQFVLAHCSARASLRSWLLAHAWANGSFLLFLPQIYAFLFIFRKFWAKNLPKNRNLSKKRRCLVLHRRHFHLFFSNPPHLSRTSLYVTRYFFVEQIISSFLAIVFEPFFYFTRSFLPLLIMIPRSGLLRR